MKAARKLRDLRFLALTFCQERAIAAQTASEIGIAVASLSGVLPDAGKSIAFAAAALLFAGCAGMRQFAFEVLDREIRTELREMGDRP